MDIDTYFHNQVKSIEATLESLIPEKQTPYSQLFQAARYSLLAGGKRLRPILTIATAETFGSHCQLAIQPACAIEMIHTYSLIHDDLPCMDNDDFRRGKPSLHKAFTEAEAVLAGDYLLTYAFEVVARDAHLTAIQKVDLITLLAKNSGSEGMIAGQVMDIAAENTPVDLEALKHIHNHKTGALITASIEFGGIIGRASQQELNALRNFGNDIGLAFQIIDDVLDVTSPTQKRGQATSSDITNKKSTYVSLMGLNQARDAAHNLLNSGLSHLESIKHDTSTLKAIAHRLVHRNH